MKALLLIPHGPAYARVADTLQKSLREAGFEPWSIDQIISAGELLSTVIGDAIRDADLIVADVSRKNPNIMYDLGLAHGLGKPTIPGPFRAGLFARPFRGHDPVASATGCLWRFSSSSSYVAERRRLVPGRSREGHCEGTSSAGASSN